MSIATLEAPAFSGFAEPKLVSSVCGSVDKALAMCGATAHCVGVAAVPTREAGSARSCSSASRRVRKNPARRWTLDLPYSSGNTRVVATRFSSAKPAPEGASVRSDSTHQRLSSPYPERISRNSNFILWRLGSKCYFRNGQQSLHRWRIRSK